MQQTLKQTSQNHSIRMVEFTDLGVSMFDSMVVLTFQIPLHALVRVIVRELAKWKGQLGPIH